MIEALCFSQNIKTNLTIDDFNILDNCGKNNWGNVCKIVSNTNNLYFAIIINKNELTHDEQNKMIEQIQYYINVSFHLFISSLEAIFEWEQYVFIFCEYHEINLAYLVGNKSYWSEVDTEQKIGIFSNIAFAVNACHKRDVVHLNIKMENIAINTDGNACLFNFSQCSCVGSNLEEVLIHPAPPESRLLGSALATKAMDCWALGLLLYELIDDNCIFTEESENKFNFDLFPPQIIPIVKGLLENDPEKRWNIDQSIEYLLGIGY